jgi:hypothetical protein
MYFYIYIAITMCLVFGVALLGGNRTKEGFSSLEDFKEYIQSFFEEGTEEGNKPAPPPPTNTGMSFVPQGVDATTFLQARSMYCENNCTSYCDTECVSRGCCEGVVEEEVSVYDNVQSTDINSSVSVEVNGANYAGVVPTRPPRAHAGASPAMKQTSESL